MAKAPERGYGGYSKGDRIRVIFKNGHVEDFEDADYQKHADKVRAITGPHGTIMLDMDEVACVRSLPPEPVFRWWR